MDHSAQTSMENTSSETEESSYQEISEAPDGSEGLTDDDTLSIEDSNEVTDDSIRQDEATEDSSDTDHSAQTSMENTSSETSETSYQEISEAPDGGEGLTDDDTLSIEDSNEVTDDSIRQDEATEDSSDTDHSAQTGMENTGSETEESSYQEISEEPDDSEGLTDDDTLSFEDSNEVTDDSIRQDEATEDSSDTDQSAQRGMENTSSETEESSYQEISEAPDDSEGLTDDDTLSFEDGNEGTDDGIQQDEGTAEGIETAPEGTTEGTTEETDTEGTDTEGTTEGTDTEGTDTEGTTEGTDTEGTDTEGTTEGTDTEGTDTEGTTEGTDTEETDTEGTTEGTDTEGTDTEGTTEGTDTEGTDAEGATEGTTEETDTEETDTEGTTEGTDTEGTDTEGATEGTTEETDTEETDTEGTTEGTDTEGTDTEGATEGTTEETDTEGADTEGATEGTTEGTDTEETDTEGTTEGTDTEGTDTEGTTEGTDTEGTDTEGATEGTTEGTDTEETDTEGATEGTTEETDTEGTDTEGTTEGTDTEGTYTEGTTEGTSEGTGRAEGVEDDRPEQPEVSDASYTDAQKRSAFFKYRMDSNNYKYGRLKELDDYSSEELEKMAEEDPALYLSLQERAENSGGEAAEIRNEAPEAVEEMSEGEQEAYRRYASDSRNYDHNGELRSFDTLTDKDRYRMMKEDPELYQALVKEWGKKQVSEKAGDAADTDSDEEFMTPMQYSKKMHDDIRRSWMDGFEKTEAYFKEHDPDGYREKLELYRKGLEIEYGSEARALSDPDIEGYVQYKNGLDTKSEGAFEEFTRQRLERERVRKHFEEKFITNDGEEIEYRAALDRITARLDDLMYSAGITDENQRRFVTEDIEKIIIQQELESETRGIGDHGIKHIFGNFERSDNYLRDMDASDKERIAMIIAQAYHDTGYMEYKGKGVFVTEEGEHKGEKNQEYSDADHDILGAEKWHEKKERYNGIIQDQQLMDSIENAIKTHNREEPEVIIEATGGDDKITKALLYSDKLALSEREKLARFYDDTRVMEKIADTQCTMQLLKEAGMIEVKGGGKAITSMDDTAKELVGSMKKDIYDMIDERYARDPELSDEDNRRIAELNKSLKEAVDKDVSLNAGVFSVPMNYIRTSSNSVRYNKEKGITEIGIDVLKYPDMTEKDTEDMGGQINKLLRDLGYTKEEIKEEGLVERLCRGETCQLKGRKDELRVNIVETDHKKEEFRDYKEYRDVIEGARTEYSRSVRNKIEKLIKRYEGRDVTEIPTGEFYKMVQLLAHQKYDPGVKRRIEKAAALWKRRDEGSRREAFRSVIREAVGL